MKENMKKTISLSVLAFMTCLIYAKPFSKGTTLYISTKTAKLRKSEAALSTTVATLNYGDKCIVLESNDKNTKIQFENEEEGWISNGSLTKKKITASSKSTVAGKTLASVDELAMAGKGFSAKAEEAFKKSNSQLNYSLINEIEAINIENEEIAEFIKEGHLNGGEQ